MKKQILRCSLFFLGLLAIAGCSEQSEEASIPLEIGSTIWPGYEMLYLADHLGNFHHNKVSIHQFDSASDVMRSFASGKINAAALTLDESLLLWDQGLPIEIITILDISDGGDMLLSKPYIHTFDDLKGKIVGLENTALGAYMLERFRQYSGIQEDEITTKSITIDLHSQAFKNNKVDAIITYNPQASMIKSMGANTLFTSKDIPNEIIDVVVISKGKNKPSRANIQSFLAGYYDTQKQFQADQAPYLGFISERLELSKEATAQTYQELKLPTKEESLALMGIGGVMINSLNYMSFVLQRAGLIKQDCDCRALINLSHIDETQTSE